MLYDATIECHDFYNYSYYTLFLQESTPTFLFRSSTRESPVWKMLKYGMMVIQDREPDISLAFECFIAVYWILKIHHVLC